MPDTKITALAAIGANPIIPSTFPIPMVDLTDTSMAASGTTKKVTVNQILQAGGTATLASATITGNLTLSAGTANGVGYLNASKVLTAGSALTFDGTNLGIGGTGQLRFATSGGAIGDNYIGTENSFNMKLHCGRGSTSSIEIASDKLLFYTSASERYRIANDGVATWSNVGGVAGTAMTLNSGGLGVGVAASTLANSNRVEVKGLLGSNYTLRTASTNANARDWMIAANINSFGDFAIRQGNSQGAEPNSGTDRLVIDLNGNVGIGVAPSAWNNNYNALDIGQNGTICGRLGTSNTVDIVSNGYRNSAGNWVYKLATSNTACRYQLDGSTGAHIWYSGAAGTAGNTIAGFSSAAMTLDASGNLLVGTTSTATSSGNGFKVLQTTSGHFDPTVITAQNSGIYSCWDIYSTGGTAGYRFYVTSTGTINAVNTTISAISDARLKENVQDIDVGLGAILALKPRKFDWKEGKGKNIKGDRGFIAQEFEQVFPQLVDEWKDAAPEGEAPYKSVRQDLIPVLVKAIQELAARVQTLETR